MPTDHQAEKEITILLGVIVSDYHKKIKLFLHNGVGRKML